MDRLSICLEMYNFSISNHSNRSRPISFEKLSVFWVVMGSGISTTSVLDLMGLLISMDWEVNLFLTLEMRFPKSRFGWVIIS